MAPRAPATFAEHGRDDAAGHRSGQRRDSPTIVAAAGTNQSRSLIQWQQPGETTVRNMVMINWINGAI
jgi:hypothetical protein